MGRLKNKQCSVRGFSLLEVVISMFVLSIGFLASIGLATNSIRNSFFQRDEVVASELAQEGLELVYNIRDTNIANGATDEFQGIGVLPGYRSYVFYNTGSFGSISLVSASTACSGPTVESGCMVYTDTNGYYVQGSGNPTKFFRRIDVHAVSDKIRKITSIVVQRGGVVPALGSDYASTCLNNEENRCVYVQLQLEKE